MKWIDVDGVQHIAVGPQDRLAIVRMVTRYSQYFSASVLVVECAQSGEKAYKASIEDGVEFVDLYMGSSEADAFQAYEHAVKNKGAS